ncbi:SDR family NAD(P)-dependent oxidoreductase [Saccharopolyspora taberi]|uniref:SDR family NAD(P)-dependent oxidoreductase n=1 Tax=Saccharopolyspora taberi TaxID=60895 RepID=A0ABN3V3N7_9PSEU
MSEANTEAGRPPVALITGATAGIGRVVARELAARGMTTLLGYRNRERGERVAAELGADGRVIPVHLDVTRESTIAAAAEWIEAEFGVLDVLVNNAGVNVGSNVPSEVTAEDMRQVYETNVVGVVATTHAMLPLLSRAEAARVVNVSSQLGSLALASAPDNPWHSLLAYHSSKSALNMLTVHYAREFADTPMKINSVCPGRCATAINDFTGTRTPEQGAEVVLRFATLGPDGPTGGFFNDEGRIGW